MCCSTNRLCETTTYLINTERFHTCFNTPPFGMFNLKSLYWSNNDSQVPTLVLEVFSLINLIEHDNRKRKL